jgi:hypothetical protein
MIYETCKRASSLQCASAIPVYSLDGAAFRRGFEASEHSGIERLTKFNEFWRKEMRREFQFLCKIRDNVTCVSTINVDDD